MSTTMNKNSEADLSAFGEKYELERLLGSGAFGDVWECRPTQSCGAKDKTDSLACKVVQKASMSEEGRRALEAEVSIMRRVRGQHQGVVQLHEVLESPRAVQVVMEKCSGGDLFDLVNARGAMPEASAKVVFSQLASTLCFLHSQGIVHRDIKPENIMLTSAGQAKITDFGVARCLTSGTITQAGTIIGALYYMSPEQAGAKEVDQRADIYSMGVVVYEMATGHRPFEGPDVATLIGQHLSSIPRSPKELQPDLPEEIERAIMRALEKDPDKRFQTAGEMAEALHCKMETIH